MKNWKSDNKANVTKQKQHSSHKFRLMLKVFYWCSYLFLLTACTKESLANNFRHAEQILSVTCNLQLPVPKRTISALMEYQGKLNENYVPLLHCTSCLTGTSCKKFFFVLLFYMSFYISTYNFLHFFKTSFNIVWKKIFVTNFPFVTNSSKLPTPLMTKIC